MRFVNIVTTIFLIMLCILYSPSYAIGKTISLHKAVNESKVKVEISGLGGSTGDTILLQIKRLIPLTMQLSITPGSVFKSESGKVQDMVFARIKGERMGDRKYRPSSKIVLTDNANHSYIVEAYCLDFHKSNPGKNDTFILTAPDKKTAKILKAGNEQSLGIAAIQSAIWIDRANISDSELTRRFPVSNVDLKAAHKLIESIKGKSSSQGFKVNNSVCMSSTPSACSVINL